MLTNQNDLANKHHHLIEEYLHSRGLRVDDYYDIAVFGFLRAINGCDDESRFPEIARSEMSLDVEQFLEDQLARPGEVSLDQFAVGAPSAHDARTFLSAVYLMNTLDTVLTGPERRMIAHLEHGEELEDAVRHSGLHLDRDQASVHRVRQIATELCCA